MLHYYLCILGVYRYHKGVNLTAVLFELSLMLYKSKSKYEEYSSNQESEEYQFQF
jgi:hypothetical protein